jgi:4-amino-4-deoxy-L-arabinose transferase-like glycosyltransferase
VLLAVGLGALLPGIFTLPLIDRDEPRFARATVEMAERGDWIVPYFNAEYRFDKPPLTYWWMGLHYALLGRTEGAARLHSVFAALGVAAILFLWGRQLFDRSVGWWAALGWLTCIQVLMHGRLVLADMPMILAVTAGQWCLWQILVVGSPQRRWWWGWWGSLAFGFLAKGPIAWFVPILTWGLFWGMTRRTKAQTWHWRGLRPAWGVVLVLLTVGAWGLPALLLTHGDFWKIGIGKHVVERGFESFNERVYFPFFYFLTIFLSLFPWSGGLPGALRQGWKDNRALPRLLIAWTLAPILIFLFYRTQLPHYILPGFGGALLLIFGYGHPGRGWFAGSLRIIFGILALALAGFALLAEPRSDLQFLRGTLLGVSLLLAGAVVLAAVPASLFSRLRAARLALGVLALGIGFAVFARLVEDAAMSPRLAEVVDASPESRAVSVGYGEPSLVFYTGRPWEFPSAETVEKDPETLDSAAVVVIKQREWRDARLWRAFWDGSLVEPPKPSREAALSERLLQEGWTAQAIAGLNFARFSWVEVLVLRPPDR